MKLITIVTAILICTTITNAQQNAGIGTTNPDSTAILDLTSTSQGLLPPRLSIAQRDAIQVPATGLLIFNTTSNCVNYFDGSQWIEVCERSGTGGTGTGDCCSNVAGMPTMISSSNGQNIDFGTCMLYCDTLTEGGYEDWIVPTLDELTYSLGGGTDVPDNRQSVTWSRSRAYINQNATPQYYYLNEINGRTNVADGANGTWRCRCIRY